MYTKEFIMKMYVLFSILSALLFAQKPEPKPCDNPAVATDDLGKKFRYGCFCGEDYPNIQHPSKKSYRDLNLTEKQELIAQYNAIAPYDDIDKVCQEHDICFIIFGRKAESCNDTIYSELNLLEDKFRKKESKENHYEQCANLASDMGSVFHTIFAPSDDDDTLFDLGILMINGAVTAANKGFQESIDMLTQEEERYPPANVKCMVSEK